MTMLRTVRARLTRLLKRLVTLAIVAPAALAPAGLLAALLVPGLAPAAAQAADLAAELAKRPGWQVYPTPFDFQTLSERVKAAVAAEKMGLVTRASASDGAHNLGYEIPGNEVLGIFRNDYARRMLSASIAAGIEAPIRLYLVETEDRSAILAFKRPSAVFAPYMSEGGNSLKRLAEELDMVLEDIAGKATDLDWQPN